MKRMGAAVVMLATVGSSPALADVDKALCIEMLSRPALGVTGDYPNVAALYGAWDEKDGWQINRELQRSYVSLSPSSMKNYKISVVEESEETGQAVSLLDVDCPVPTAWAAIEQPKVAVSFPSKVVNADTVNSLRESHTLHGLDFTTPATSREALGIHALWRVLEASPQSQIELPPYVPADKVVSSRLSLKKANPPAVRAFRISPISDVGRQQLWHLVLAEDVAGQCTYFAVDNEASGYFDLNLTDATRVAREVESLTYWNAETQRVIECLNTANYLDPKNCARVNMQAYGSVLENLRQNQPIYVQLLVKMGNGFALPTYKVEKAGITLLGQPRVSAPAELGLPIELNW